MDCTEAYKEHIMYSFNGFCKVVIRYAAINTWRDRNRRRQREISFEYQARRLVRSSSFVFIADLRFLRRDPILPPYAGYV